MRPAQPSSANTWLTRRSVQARIDFDRGRHQFVCMQGALHQSRDLSGTREPHGLVGRSMAVRRVDDLDAI